jgi:hypothetical protein
MMMMMMKQKEEEEEEKSLSFLFSSVLIFRKRISIDKKTKYEMRITYL